MPSSRWFLPPIVLSLVAATDLVADMENPYKSESDSTIECYEWAANGQCALNPDFMLETCKYSCWEWYKYRKVKFIDAPIDKDFECHGWSKGGECHNNPVRLGFMLMLLTTARLTP